MDDNIKLEEIVSDEKLLEEIDKNIIFAINKILDSKELQRTFSLKKEKILILYCFYFASKKHN